MINRRTNPMVRVTTMVHRSKNQSKSDRERYIEKLESHIDSTNNIVKYSLERFDVLIISLSGGGLILSISLVKDVIKDFEKIDHSLLKGAWICFGISLILNLFSQITSYYANKEEVKISRNIIRQKRGKLTTHDLNKLENIKRVLNFFTVSFNGLCVIAFVIAILLLIIFMNNNI